MAYTLGTTKFSPSDVDAFGRLRISELINQFEAKFTYGIEEKTYNTTVVSGGTATFLANEAAWNLTTNTTSGSRVIRESYRYFQYHPGKSQLILATGVFGTPTSSCVKRIGYYDDNDGLYFVQDGLNGFGVCKRTSTSGSPIDSIVYQSSWSIDKMDGSGPSGITLDVTKTHIFVIDFQWLGVGAVRFGVVIDGVLIYVHQMNHANVISQVYMKSAWLPMRYEILNTSTNTGGTLKQICSHVASESGLEEIGNIRTVTNSTAVTITTGSWTPIIGIQVSPTLNGYQFRGMIRPLNIEAIVTGNSPVMFKLVENPVLTGASWAPIISTSPVNYDLSATSYTGGIDRLSFAGTSSKASTSADTPQDLVASAGNILYVVAKGIGGNSSVYCGLNWREII